MKKKTYILLLAFFITVSVAFCIFIGLSLVLPREPQEHQGEATNDTVAIESASREQTEAPVTTEIESETEADTEVDYLSIFYEGMTSEELYDAISSAGYSKISDWRMVFVTDGSDGFCLIQQCNAIPDYSVSHVSVHTFKAPTEADVAMLTEGKSIVEITEVWGCPTRILPQSNLAIAKLEYDLANGKTVFMEYTYDEEKGMYFLGWYLIYD